MRRLATALALAAAALAGCDQGGGAGETGPPETLSAWGFFEGPLAELRPAPHVHPYTVAAPLWADHAEKGRFIALPEGEAVGFDPGEAWRFPVGAVVIKTFFFALDRRAPDGAARIVETRLLVRDEAGWRSETYVWNDAQTEARRTVVGARVKVDVVDLDGTLATQEYVVPNLDQCASCHERDDELHLLGAVTAQVNRDVEVDGEPVAQLAWLAERGLFDGPIPAPGTLDALAPPTSEAATLDQRARAYLHGNCAHCHRAGGGAGKSGLSFVAWEDDPTALGICKIPAAAGAGAGGRSYDIVPGFPEDSIVPFRMRSTDPEIKMPELPNRLPDDAGVALIEAWIAAMEPPGCDP